MYVEVCMYVTLAPYMYVKFCLYVTVAPYMYVEVCMYETVTPYMYVDVCMYVCMYVYVYIFMYIIYTYTPSPVRSNLTIYVCFIYTYPMRSTRYIHFQKSSIQ
jgi:hypothetical protein